MQKKALIKAERIHYLIEFTWAQKRLLKQTNKQINKKKQRLKISNGQNNDDEQRIRQKLFR